MQNYEYNAQETWKTNSKYANFSEQKNLTKYLKKCYSSWTALTRPWEPCTQIYLVLYELSG